MTRYNAASTALLTGTLTVDEFNELRRAHPLHLDMWLARAAARRARKDGGK